MRDLPAQNFAENLRDLRIVVSVTLNCVLQVRQNSRRRS